MSFARPALANLNDSFASLEVGFNPRPEPLKRRQQCCLPAIAESHPNQFDFRSGLACKVEEIFVFTDDNEFMGLRITADGAVRAARKSNIKDVLAVTAAIFHVLRESSRKLCVNEELHDD